MLVLFSHLLAQNTEWRRAEITINSIATTSMMQTHTLESLRRLTRAARIEANLDVVIKPPDTKVQDMIVDRSKDADVVFMGLRRIVIGEESNYAERLNTLSNGLGNVLFVRNSGIFRGQLLGSTKEHFG